MPYCEQHNEVYRGEECPVCADEVEAGGDTDATDASNPTSDGDGLDVDGIVEDALKDVGDDLDEAGGDMVVGSQEKEVEETDYTEVDDSTTLVDQSQEVHDKSTTIEDSVVNRSDVGGESDGVDIEDSVVNRSNVGGGSGEEVSPSTESADSTDEPVEDVPIEGRREERSGHDGSSRRNRERAAATPETGGPGESTSGSRGAATSGDDAGSSNEGMKHCVYCGEEIPRRASHCPKCGEAL